MIRNYTVKNLFTAAARTTSADGSAVDLQATIHPGGREIKAYLDLEALAGTSPSIDCKIQESDTTTAGDFTDITGASFTTLTTDATEELHFQTSKRYIRAVLTFSANTTSATGGVYAFVKNMTT